FFIAIRVPFEGSGEDNESITSIGVSGLYDEYYWTFLMFLRVLVQGENVLEGNYLFQNLNWLQAFIYLISLSLIIVILLNIFIAQVSDTYTNAKTKSQRIVAYYRLKYIS
ncbi:hypothetical protein, partial [Salmonella sp. s51228]|uniref:hypothetical protein n=1 Tax=Salmonella sp. s51228 TaxID=3159652 RepID=UPI00397E98D3